MRYAADTWRSMTAMIEPSTGLVADNIAGDLAPAAGRPTPRRRTSAAIMWSAVVAARPRASSPAREATARASSRPCDTLAGLERHHDAVRHVLQLVRPADGAMVTVWPEDGNTVTPFLSSVDNGWLAAALVVVAGAVPELRGQGRPDPARPMDFGFYYNPAATAPIGLRGLIRGGFWDTAAARLLGVDNYRDRGPDVWFTCNHYDITVTEPRIASYLGIAPGQIPPTALLRHHAHAAGRTATTVWQEKQPVGLHHHPPRRAGVRGLLPLPRHPVRAELGRRHVRGADARPVRARGRGGARTAGAATTRRPCAGQIEHGMNDAEVRLLGLLAGVRPVRRVPACGASTRWAWTPTATRPTWSGTNVRRRLRRLPPGRPGAGPTATAWSPRTRRSSPCRTRRGPVVDNLARLKANLDAYGPGGFYDAVAVRQRHGGQAVPVASTRR